VKNSVVTLTMHNRIFS